MKIALTDPIEPAGEAILRCRRAAARMRSAPSAAMPPR
jgi:hypothetical protein